MDRIDAMAMFVAAVDEGSLAKAARRHGRSPATLSRAVAMLEAEAGETLLLRSTRQLSLTAAGERHVATWRDVLSRLDALTSSTGSDGVRGRIVLTAPELFGRQWVLPIVGDYLGRHPAVSARVVLANRLIDLTGEGFDLAVRLAPLPDSNLRAVRLGSVRTLLCAAPDHLARWGTPADPRDLNDHACIGLNTQGDGELWSFGKGRRARAIRVRTRLAVDHAGGAIDAALRGEGIVRVRSYQVADAIAAGRLVRLLPMHEPPPTPVHLVFHPERGTHPAVRAFIDQAVPALRAALAAIDGSVPAPPGDD